MRQALSRRRFLAGTASACVGAAAAGSGTAEAKSATDIDTPRRSDIASALDDAVQSSLAEHDVPGATVALVSEDETLTKGYGVQDRDSEAPVDPAETVFRIGSVSKAVTATALMQRVQQGDIDPSEGVSEYVDVPIDGEAPVTLEQLVTHRGGFEASNRGMWIPDAEELRPLPWYLRNEPQKRVREPGTVGSYSNFGYALAGQVLAAVAEAPFHRAVEQELLAPAGMTESSFQQPLPEALAGSHATGYSQTGAFADGEFPLLGLRPAGAMSATATDMARFLELHLNGGQLDGAQVLEPGTVAAMHDRWATHHEGLAGMGFGLIEEFRGDVRTLWHNGATLSFYSHLALVPDHDFGLFVSFNAAAGGAAAEEVVDTVLDELLPDHDQGQSSPDGTPTRAEDLEGTYRSLQQSHTWHDRATSVLNAGTVTVRVAGDGALLTRQRGSEERWIEVEPLVFEHAEGGQRIAFGELDGAIEYLFRGGSPTALGRVEGVESLQLHGVLALCTLLGTLSAVVGWPAGGFYRRVLAERRGEAGNASWARLLATPVNRAKILALAVAVTLLGSLLAIVAHFFAAPLLVLSDPPTTFRVLFSGPLLGLAGTIGAVGFTGRLWASKEGSLLTRVHYTLVTASLGGFCWLLWYWNLLIPPA
jgi:CubicO group peptidase (beta-lactamase class C family)